MDLPSVQDAPQDDAARRAGRVPPARVLAPELAGTVNAWPADGRPGSFIRLTHGMVNRIVMALDAVVMAGFGLALSGPLWGVPSPVTTLQALVLSLLQAVCFHAAMRGLGAYRLERYTHPLRMILDVAASFAAALALMAVVLHAFVPGGLYQPRWLLSWEGCLLALLLADRLVARLIVWVVDREELLRQRVILISDRPTRDVLMRRLLAPATRGRCQVVGFVNDTGEDGDAGVEAIRAYSRTHPIDMVMVALPWTEAARALRMVEKLQWLSVDIVMAFDEAVFEPKFARLIDVNGVNGLQLFSRPFKGTMGLTKMAEDYVVAALALLVASPVLLLAALLIRLDSPGPALFRQVRTGFNDKPFRIFKFRTMVVDKSDDGSLGTQGRDDPRITRVGRVLRRLSIDELPQLLNVLRGEMSVVGPRPYVPNMLVGEERFTEAVRDFATRHRIKPGITGYAQAHGFRGGGLKSVEQARASVKMDVHYIMNWSLWFDLKIMLRTAVIGMVGRNVF